MARKKLLILLGSVCLVLLLTVLPVVSCTTPTPTPPTPPTTPTGIQAEVYKLQCQHYLSRGIELWDISAEWAEAVKEASGGRLDIEVYGADEIIPLSESFEACSKGVIPMTISLGIYWTGKIPVAAFGSCSPPGTLRSITEITAFYHQYGIEDLLREAYADHNMFFVRGEPASNVVLMTQFPVTKLADLEGHVIRAAGMAAEVLEELGAATTYFPVGEIYGALERGLCDGVIYDGIGCEYSMGFHEVTDYLVLSPPIKAAEGYELLVNADVWESLPDDLKGILYQSFAQHAIAQQSFILDDDMACLEKMRNEWGIETIVLSSEEDQKMLAEAGVTVLDKYAQEDPYFAEAAARLKDFMRKLGYL